MPPHDLFERRLRIRGADIVAGIDEAGRGPLAGPVAAAAVILDPGDVPDGLDDSKLLPAARREELYDEIMGRALAVGIGFASVAVIDRINIRQATFAAMRQAVAALSLRPACLLIDGNDAPPHLPCPAETLIKGDSLSVSIAAASIVAKVLRDRLMVRLHEIHPVYDFKAHKGYGTAGHRAAIAAHGLSPHHRKLFCTPRAEDARNVLAKKS